MKTARTQAAVGVLFAVAVAGFPATAAAEVRLPAVFGDHMVIQQEKPVSIWGWAGRGEEVTVLLAGAEKKARAGADGIGRVRLGCAAGGPPLAPAEPDSVPVHAAPAFLTCRHQPVCLVRERHRICTRLMPLN